MAIPFMTRTVLASDLYYPISGSFVNGKFEDERNYRHECHWCGAPCKDEWRHDDPLPDVGVKKSWLAKRPANHYICDGCMNWRKKRITVQFLSSGQYVDSRSPMDFSWLVTLSGSWAIRSQDHQLLYEILLHPPLCFSLSLNNTCTSGMPGQVFPDNERNLIQFSTVNYHQQINADTKLFYTLNNSSGGYTVYELEHALKHGLNGKDPGVRNLVRFLGNYKSLNGDKPTNKVGRPTYREEEKAIKKVVSKQEVNAE